MGLDDDNQRGRKISLGMPKQNTERCTVRARERVGGWKSDRQNRLIVGMETKQVAVQYKSPAARGVHPGALSKHVDHAR